MMSICPDLTIYLTDLDRLILQYQSQEGSLQNQEDSCQFWDLSKNMATGKEH